MVKLEKLNNKITILHEKITNLPIISLSLFISGGIKLENKKNNGITNLTLKLLGKKTKNQDFLQIYDFLDTHKIKITKSVAKDYTHFSITSLKEDFKDALKLFKNILYNSVIEENEFKKEKENIISYLKGLKDNLYLYSAIKFNEDIFQDHPYGLYSKGDINSVNKLQLQDIKIWIEKLLNRNFIISIAGDINLDESKDLIKEYILNTNRYIIIKEDNRSKIPELTKNKIKEHILDKEQATINIGYILDIKNIKEYISARVLAHTISGMGSKLFVNLRDNLGLAYSVYGRYIPYKDVSLFKFFMGTRNKNLDFAIESLFKEINSIKKGDFSKEELEKGKNYSKGLYYISTQKISDKTFFNGHNFILGLTIQDINSYTSLLENITIEDIKNITKQLNRPYLLSKIYKKEI